MEIPKLGQWTFESENIAKSFDAHVREQLPFYENQQLEKPDTKTRH